MLAGSLQLLQLERGPCPQAKGLTANLGFVLQTLDAWEGSLIRGKRKIGCVKAGMGRGKEVGVGRGSAPVPYLHLFSTVAEEGSAHGRSTQKSDGGALARSLPGSGLAGHLQHPGH